MEVLGNSEKYFAAVRNEGYGEPLLYYLPFMILGAVFGALTWLRYFSEYFSISLSGVFFLPLFMGEIVVQLATLFFILWLIHVCLRLCKGQGRYVDTFKAGVYASTPTLLWSVLSGPLSLMLTQQRALWLIFPSLAFMVWSIYLEVTGLAQYHAVSKSRAFWAGVVLPLAVLFVAMLVIGLFFVFFWAALFTGIVG